MSWLSSRTYIQTLKICQTVLVLCFLVGTTSIAHAVHSNSKSNEVENVVRHSARTDKQVVQVSPPSPASSTEPVSTPPSPTIPQSSVSKTTVPKPKPPASKPVSSPQADLCFASWPGMYDWHNKVVYAEYHLHLQNLADLKQAYDQGDYYITDEIQEYNDYQDDVADENNRWNQAIVVIDTEYKAKQVAAGCKTY